MRLEMRALPSGPGIEDMLANVAFLVGATLGLAPVMDEVVREFDFQQAHRNFYRAAQGGLQAELFWPARLGGGDTPLPARELLPGLRDVALRGLLGVGVAEGEAVPLLDRLHERVRTGQTGATWQRDALAALEQQGTPRSEALPAMLERYLELSQEGGPVHRWPVCR